MYDLDESWLRENFREGNISNTEVGMVVYIKGYDFWDEVLYPHVVTSVGVESITSYESNSVGSIPPLERGEKISTEWFIKK